jgi:DNA-binding MltR family transcriptional regulator
MANISDVQNKISELASAVSKLKTQCDILVTFTDAHSVIIGATQLDSALEEALLTKMCQLSRDMKDDIFDGHGPLNNFAAKILMAYALELISREFYHSLLKINKIRVSFAHSKTFMSFQDPEISKIIDSLPGLDLTIASRKERFFTQNAVGEVVRDKWAARRNIAVKIAAG